eukprot:Sspe_Gene.72174::Locus_42989_Transcript_1_1_Confidence_1.000_Length_2147::g.72174::m.72174
MSTQHARYRPEGTRQMLSRFVYTPSSQHHGPSESRQDLGSTLASTHEDVERRTRSGEGSVRLGRRPQKQKEAEPLHMPMLASEKQKKVVWRVVVEGKGEVLPDGVAATLEGGYKTGKEHVDVVFEGQLYTAKLGEMVLVSTVTADTLSLIRDDYADIDFYGRKQFLAKHRQAELADLRRRREERRVKGLWKAPPHCHLYYNPHSEESSKIPSQFPLRTVITSIRDVVSFASGSKRIAKSEEAPLLSCALPRVSMVLDLDRRQSCVGGLASFRYDHHLPAVGRDVVTLEQVVSPGIEVDEQGTDDAEEGGDEGHTHHHQLFMNNFAGIRAIIDSMPPELPRLDLSSSKTKTAQSGRTPKTLSSSIRQQSDKTADSDDDWQMHSSDEEGEEDRQNSKHLEQTLQSRSWKGPYDTADAEESEDGSEGYDYDHNCAICRKHLERSQLELEIMNGGDQAKLRSINLGKSQEWINIIYSTKLRASRQLQSTLEKRQATKDYVTQSPKSVAQLSIAAEENAKKWDMMRYTSKPVRDECPTIWNKASVKLYHERHRRGLCILFYSRLLYYLDVINAPSTPEQVEIVDTVRNILIRERNVSRQLFYSVLRTMGPRIIESKENMKIVHYLRIELGISTREFIRFVKGSKGWNLTHDLILLADNLKKQKGK